MVRLSADVGRKDVVVVVCAFFCVCACVCDWRACVIMEIDVWGIVLQDEKDKEIKWATMGKEGGVNHKKTMIRDENADYTNISMDQRVHSATNTTKENKIMPSKIF